MKTKPEFVYEVWATPAMENQLVRGSDWHVATYNSPEDAYAHIERAKEDHSLDFNFPFVVARVRRLP